MDENKENIDPNERIEADWIKPVWCVDSETSESVLIDRKTNKIIARRDKNGNII